MKPEFHFRGLPELALMLSKVWFGNGAVFDSVFEGQRVVGYRRLALVRTSPDVA